MGVGHYENFPVATLLCPPALRAPVRAIYAFARTADDLADEGDWPAAQRLAQLNRYRAALTTTAAQIGGDAPVPATEWPEVFGPLAAALRRHGLAPPLLHALLDAFEQDVHNPPYPDRAALLAYCSRSANPVGRLLLHLYGIADERAQRESDAICSALQLINFWQDLSIDLPRGRHYVPQADLARHGLSGEPPALHDTPAARALVRDLTGWAAALLAEGAALPLRIPGRAGWELRLVVHGGWRILEKIAQMEYRSFARRPRLLLRDAPLLGWRAATYRPGWFHGARLR